MSRDERVRLAVDLKIARDNLTTVIDALMLADPTPQDLSDGEDDLCSAIEQAKRAYHNWPGQAPDRGRR